VKRRDYPQHHRWRIAATMAMAGIFPRLSAVS
jgi:hypothetical protein